MTKTILTIAAAVAVSLTAFGAPAQAGGKGVKLNFGGKLGTFKAVPTRGFKRKKRGFRNHNVAALRRAKIAAAKKRRLLAIKKARIAAARKAKIAAAKKAKIAALRKAKIAQKRRIAALKKASQRRAQQEIERQQEAERVSVQKVAGASEVIPAETKVTNTDTSEAELSEVVVEDNENREIDVADATQATPPTPEASPNREITCKKFIPSAGMTITVPCQD